MKKDMTENLQTIFDKKAEGDAVWFELCVLTPATEELIDSGHKLNVDVAKGCLTQKFTLKEFHMAMLANDLIPSYPMIDLEVETMDTEEKIISLRTDEKFKGVFLNGATMAVILGFSSSEDSYRPLMFHIYTERESDAFMFRHRWTNVVKE